MFSYSQYIFYSQNELKHSGLKILAVYVVLGHFELKLLSNCIHAKSITQ